MKKTFSFLALIFLVSCHSVEKFPEATDVKVGANVHPDCQEVGNVRGRSSSKTPDDNTVMEDLKREASQKGANYVQIKQKSSYGTEVVGLAFKCP